MYHKIAIWFRFEFYAILIMVLLGGTTRLTGSGLSIVDWRPVTGAIPPLNEAQWKEEFLKYQTSPEFKVKNFQLDLDGFKKIFFWEYVHRLWGRLLGFFLVLPALYFWRRMEKWVKIRVVVVFLLLGMQGMAGWLMVKSGLLSSPNVSHFRLAIHFLLALWILFIVRWTELEVGSGRKSLASAFRHKKLILLCSILILQLTYGAFLAGTKAGWAFSTFPTMNGQWFPSGALAFAPGWLNLFENGILIHWIHRAVGTAFLALVLYFVFQSAHQDRRALLPLGVFVFAQYLLGAVIVMLGIPVYLGVAHQFLAVIVFSSLINLIYVKAQNRKCI